MAQSGVTGNLNRINGFLKGMADATRPGSRVQNHIRGEAQKIVHEETIKNTLAGKDADGGTTAPLAQSTLNHRKGSGPPRVPKGSQSDTFLSHLVERWEGSGGTMVLTQKVEGVPYWKYVNDGVPSKHLPPRPMGPGPNAVRRISALWRELPNLVRRMGGGR